MSLNRASVAYDPSAPKNQMSFFDKERERLVEEISTVCLLPAEISFGLGVYGANGTCRDSRNY